MADLEKLAVQRDRGFLVRLVLGLLVSGLIAVPVFRWLTGDRTAGCMADVMIGSEPPARPPPE